MAIKRAGKNKTSKILIYSLLLLCFVSIVVFFYYYSTKPIEIRKVDVRYFVDRKIGFDLNASALTFGIIPPGGSSTRNMTIGNSRGFPIRAVVLVDKNLSSMIISERNVSVGAYDSRVVVFTLSIPSNYTLGNYSGSVLLKIYKE